MAREDLPAKGAILQRDEETYAIPIDLPGGVMDLPSARRIAEVAQKYQARTLKITGDARLALIGIREQDIGNVYTDLDLPIQPGMALCQQYIKVCPGNAFCIRGQQDTLAFARRLKEAFYPFPKIAAKIKIGISGCFNSCAEPAIKDLGLIGLTKGWVLMVGGAGGKEPLIARTIARDLDADQALAATGKILHYYRGMAARHQTRNFRLGTILAKEGTERLRRICGFA
ncbi:MAG: NAD(P)/FAD-dependent oxidoreductase [Deltaproteobacteria bacterium]|nr:NAD(P)/FAD-dependent oxidoreductase [Deltaproteobacteria bacterium]